MIIISNYIESVSAAKKTKSSRIWEEAAGQGARGFPFLASSRDFRTGNKQFAKVVSSLSSRPSRSLSHALDARSRDPRRTRAVANTARKNCQSIGIRGIQKSNKRANNETR